MSEIQNQFAAESSLWRAARITGSAQHSARFMWGGQAVVATAFGAVATAMADTNTSTGEIAVRAVVGGLIGLLAAIAVVFVFNWWFWAPRKQRNEARERVLELESEKNIPSLFEVFRRTSFLGLAINRLDDGTYRAAPVSVGVPAPMIAHRGELTSVTDFFASLEIRFTHPDGHRSETTNAIRVEPMMSPRAGPGQLDFTWDTSDPRRWKLNGLPHVLARDQALPLPMLSIVVTDGDEAGSHFDQGETCALTIRFAIRTDKGSPPLPDQVIDLIKNDFKDTDTYREFAMRKGDNETTESSSQ